MKQILSLLLLAPALHGQILGGIESFTMQENGESWGFYDYSNNETDFAPWNLFNSGDPEIFATFTQDAGVSLFADGLSSDGYFVGDYSGTGIKNVFCDIFIEDLSTFGDVEFYILAGGTFYYSDFYIIESSGWLGLDSSFSEDPWYIFDEDDDEFVEVDLTPLILSDVVEIGLNFYPASAAADGRAVGVDNFALLPDLTPPLVSITSTSDAAVFSFTGIEGMQYTIQSSPSLEADSWTSVGSPFEINGLSQTTLPIANKSFFRVLALPFYVEVP